MYVSHDFGAPKESQLFWKNLSGTERFDIKSTLFVDDTEVVLDSAKQYGIEFLLQITNPDSKQKLQVAKNHLGVRSVLELID
jgi:putative hydrolase of the HAD superfamily